MPPHLCWASVAMARCSLKGLGSMACSFECRKIAPRMDIWSWHPMIATYSVSTHINPPENHQPRVTIWKVCAGFPYFFIHSWPSNSSISCWISIKCRTFRGWGKTSFNHWKSRSDSIFLATYWGFSMIFRSHVGSSTYPWASPQGTELLDDFLDLAIVGSD